MFEELPAELLELIFSYTSASDTVQLSLVCSTFYCITNSNTLWSSLYHSEYQIRDVGPLDDAKLFYTKILVKYDEFLKLKKEKDNQRLLVYIKRNQLNWSYLRYTQQRDRTTKISIFKLFSVAIVELEEVLVCRMCEHIEGRVCDSRLLRNKRGELVFSSPCLQPLVPYKVMVLSRFLPTLNNAGHWQLRGRPLEERNLEGFTQLFDV